MVERFTELGRQVVVLAQGEARALRHNHVGTEHLLLGLFRVDDALVAGVFAVFGVTLDAVRGRVAETIGQADEETAGELPLTARSKRVLELAHDEATLLGAQLAGPEHVLLGLLREGGGVATSVLADLGAPAHDLRAEALARTSAADPPQPESERIRAEKEAAIEEHDFHRAAVLRAREAKLVRAGGHEPRLEADAAPTASNPGDLRTVGLTIAGVVLLGLGILVGWAIWG